MYVRTYNMALYLSTIKNKNFALQSIKTGTETYIFFCYYVKLNKYISQFLNLSSGENGKMSYIQKRDITKGIKEM